MSGTIKFYANWHTHCDCLNTFIGCKAIGQNKGLYDEIKQYCKKCGTGFCGANFI